MFFKHIRILELSNNTTNMFSMNFVFFTSTFKALILLSLLSLLFSLKSKCLCLIQHYIEETSNFFFSEKLHGSWILRVFCQQKKKRNHFNLFAFLGFYINQMGFSLRV